MIDQASGLLPGLAIGALTSNLAMPSRNKEGRTPLSTLLDLVSLGLVAAASIIIFGIASFALLYTSEGMSRGSGIRDRGVEVKPSHSGVFPYTHAYPPLLPEETELPGAAGEATLSTSPPGSPAGRDMQTPEVSRAQPVSEPLPPGASEGSATQDASLRGTVLTRPSEVSEAQTVSEPLPPGPSEGSVMQDASLSGTVLTRPSEVTEAQPVSELLPPGASEGSATQDASLSGTVLTRPSEVSEAQPVSEQLPPGASEGSAMQNASLIGTVLTRPPEVIGAQPVSEQLPPGASEGSATQDASLSGTVLTRPSEVTEVQAVSEQLPPGASEGSATQDASLSGTVLTRPSEVREAQAVSEPLPPGASEGSAMQDASLGGTVMTRPPEVIGAQPVSEPLPPGASEGATADASLIGTVPTPPIPAEKRDPVFREMHQSVHLGGDNAASHEKIPIKHMQQGQSHDHYFSTNAAFWMYRLRKECGPIKYPALHGDCVRSFKAQYPIGYASPARPHQKS